MSTRAKFPTVVGGGGGPRVGAGRFAGFILGAVVVLLVVLLIGALVSGSTVEPRHVGVKITMGRVEPGVLQPGFHFVIPFVQRIRQIDVGVQPIEFTDIEAASQEYQTVRLTGTLNYRIRSDNADELIQTIRDDFDDIVVIPALNDYLKQILPTYPVEQVLANRDNIRSRAKERMNANLGQYGIEVNDIYLKNISFSQEYQAAIEKKQTEQQLVLADQQTLARKRIQAEQAVADAKGRSDAAVETARGEAESNRLRASGITQELIQYLWVQKWDGKQPMVTGEATPLVELPSPSGPTGSPQAQPAPAPQPTAPRPTPTPQSR
jgi:regulator of protease activity HflC (stomatin/prohibitin superfamily)